MIIYSYCNLQLNVWGNIGKIYNTNYSDLFFEKQTPNEYHNHEFYQTISLSEMIT